MAAPIVVSNTTPLIALAYLARLDLMPTLFGTIHVPQAVYDEIQHNPNAIGAAELRTAYWLRITPVTDMLAVELLLDQLDAGESQAIVLARELNAGLVLMDERRGRRRALQSGLAVAGTIAILIRARQLGLIDQLRPMLDMLRHLPFHLSNALYQDALRRVDE